MPIKKPFKKRTSFWASVVLGVTVIQFVGLQQLDDFLKPPDVQRGNIVHAEGKVLPKPTAAPVKKVSIPKDAIQYKLTPNHTAIAYIRLASDKEEELVVQDGNGTLLRQADGKVKYMEWLGESNTLLYVIEKENKQELYLFQLEHKVPLMVHEWEGTKRQAQEVFFSPYLEFF
ncbi:hypothetical protein [Aneurinibacillus tyrosinisolvens]|uniref:hypothetical protein n=1 Tax=Aneurinibacillus tyrosinisolvens TaxID=1443435 RepID=UPI00063F6A35|nr:hypothetical protein [Aneurinibacillus tyrosinisolvens]